MDNIASGITQSGVLTADTLHLTNTAGTTNINTQSNMITHLGTIHAEGQTFAIRNNRALDQTGPLAAASLALTNTAATTTLNHAGNAIGALGTINAAGRTFILVNNVAAGLTQTGAMTASTLSLTNTAGDTALSTPQTPSPPSGRSTPPGAPSPSSTTRPSPSRGSSRRTRST